MSAMAVQIRRLFDWKIGGVRWIDILFGLAVALMVLSVYLAKTAAAREGARIAELERQIAEGRQRVHLLNAEVARLEQPGRLEALSRQIGLAPADVHRQATEAKLPELAPIPDPRPVIVEPTPTEAASAAPSVEPPAEAAR